VQHVIIGAGDVGSTLATLLAAEGQQVTILSRRGAGPRVEGVRRVAADASSLASLMGAAPKAGIVYNCANPPYTEWVRNWPPLAAALLRYAELTGAVLATCSNLYGYGPVEVPMTEGLPLASTGAKGRVRAQMWLDAKAAHDAGRIRATEVRGSDYIAASDPTRVSGSASSMRSTSRTPGPLQRTSHASSPSSVGTSEHGVGRGTSRATRLARNVR
jgi:hypothetical protein